MLPDRRVVLTVDQSPDVAPPNDLRAALASCEDENSCFVCLEPCDTKSPCECKTMYLHAECFVRVLESNGETCKICGCLYEQRGGDAWVRRATPLERAERERATRNGRAVSALQQTIVSLTGGMLIFWFASSPPTLRDGSLAECVMFYVCFACVLVLYGFYSCAMLCALLETSFARRTSVPPYLTA